MKKYFLGSIVVIGLLIHQNLRAEEASKDLGKGVSNDAKDSADKFQEHKAMSLKNVDERIESLNKMKTCLSSATKKEELKSCRETHRGSMEAMKMEHLDHHMERMKERRAKMDEKIKELEAKKKDSK